VGRLHPTNELQMAGVSKLSNEELLKLRLDDPISASGARNGINLTGGHHRTEEIIRRVKSGDLPADTTLKVLLHD
jgi:hypothetical protein